MGVFGAVSMPTWLRVSAPQSPGAARVPATFPRNKVTIRKPVGVMHACYLFTPTDNWQCVYLRKLQLSKDSLCQFAGPLNAMIHKYALTEPGIRQWYPFSWSPPEQMLARVFPSFLLRPIRHSFFPRRGWAFIAAERLNPLKALSSLSPSVHYLMMQNTLVKKFKDVQGRYQRWSCADFAVNEFLPRCSTETSQNERRGFMSLSRLPIWAGQFALSSVLRLLYLLLKSQVGWMMAPPFPLQFNCRSTLSLCLNLIQYQASLGRCVHYWGQHQGQYSMPVSFYNQFC